MSGPKQFAAFWRLIWSYSPASCLVFLGLSFLAGVTEGFGLLLVVPILDQLQGGGAAPTGLSSALSQFGVPVSLPALLAIFFAANVLRAVVQYANALQSERLRLELIDQLRSDVFETTLKATWDWSAGLKRSDVSNMLTTEIMRIGVGITFAIRLIVAVIMMLSYLGAAVFLSPAMTLAAVALGAAMVFLMRRETQLSNQLGQALTQSNRTVQGLVEESLAALKLTKISGQEARQAAWMARERAAQRGRSMGYRRLSAGMTLGFNIGVALAVVAFLFVGVQVLALDVAVLLVLVILFARLAPQVRSIQMQVSQITHSHDALVQYEGLLASGRQHQEPGLDEAQRPLSIGQEIRMEKVSYTYPAREGAALCEVTVRIPGQGLTAILGPSGSGKSTLVDILSGLLVPSAGDWVLGGQVLARAQIIQWRRAVAYVPQNGFLFHGTIRSNLAWAHPDASEEALAKALRAASAGFVLDLPEGLGTQVGDAGLQLSGGERQRICLARALLRDPQLLILDEATNALDAANEARILDSLQRIARDRAVVAISHTHRIAAQADHVVVVEGGRIADQGPWDHVQAHLS